MKPGEKVGPYEIVEVIGAGGMGDVYRARDPRVGRDVAIKTARDQFGERFEREARAVAALNHPNICTLHDVGPNYLVMEFVEGESPKGPMALAEALRIANQVADALAEAHDRGIVHRDLKPGNIKVRPDGTVKVLDFGLAKMGPTSGVDVLDENSPTRSLATLPGVILGTAAYMAPEQARGKAVDKRADIWAWGVVLYELLTGERPFKGEDLTEVLASVVKEPPDLSRVPAKVRPVLARCLEKDPRKRLRDISGVALLLERPADRPTRPGFTWFAATAALLAAAVATTFMASRWSPTEPPRVVRSSILLPEGVTLGNGPPALSPDGTRVAFAAGRQLWVRTIDGLDARPLADTDGAFRPFWRPDSRWLAFFAGDALKKVDVTTGAVMTVTNLQVAGQPSGAWSEDDVILVASSDGLGRVAGAGGNITPVLGGEASNPWFLPGGRHFLYSSGGSVYVGDLTVSSDTHFKERKALLQAVNAVYVEVEGDGRLLYLSGTRLMAQAFDVAVLRFTGDARPVTEDVSATRGSQVGQFAASSSGLLVFAPPEEPQRVRLTWFDRTGKMLGTIGDDRGLTNGVGISPDGATVAYDRQAGGTFDLWLYDVASGANTRFTFGPGDNRRPIWSPEGTHIVFGSTRNGGMDIYQRALGASAKDEPVDTDPVARIAMDWTPGYLVGSYSGGTRRDIWLLPTPGQPKVIPFIETEFVEDFPAVSPDGRLLAYRSSKAGRMGLYVIRFPDKTVERLVADNVVTNPVWNTTGGELYFYMPLEGAIMAVSVTMAGEDIRVGRPQELFRARMPTNGFFDVSKDGRFLVPVVVDAESTPRPTLTLIQQFHRVLQ